jgi:type I restriction enzyme M protein
MEIKKLQDICAYIFSGPAICTNENLSKNYIEGGYRIIRLADIQNNEICFKDCLFYNIPDYKKNQYVLQDNDILLSSRGTVFKVAIFKEDNFYKTIPSGFFTCIRLNKKNKISVRYIAAYLRYKESNIISYSGKKKIKAENTKIKIQLKLKDILNIPIPIPSVNIQNEVDKLFSESEIYFKKRLQKLEDIKVILSRI